VKLPYANALFREIIETKTRVRLKHSPSVQTDFEEWKSINYVVLCRYPNVDVESIT